MVNGFISGMGATGIVLEGGGALVEKVHLASNGQDGIIVFHGIVRDNIADSNGSVGITGNEASFNQCTGISAQCPSSLANNTVVFNGGVPGINTTGAGCALANNAEN